MTSCEHDSPPIIRSWRTVVGIAVECHLSWQAWFHHLLEPRVEGRVEKDVREDRRHSGALRHPSVRMRHASVFQDTGFQPFVNDTTDDAVAYPLVQEASEVLVIESVKGLDTLLPLSTTHSMTPWRS